MSANGLLHANEPDKVSTLISQAYLSDSVKVSFNAYLIRNEKRLILIDAGVGTLFSPEHGGKLIANIKAAV